MLTLLLVARVPIVSLYAGTFGVDEIVAGSGNDVIFADAGDDVVFGGEGFDLIIDGSQASLYTKPTIDLTEFPIFTLSPIITLSSIDEIKQIR